MSVTVAVRSYTHSVTYVTDNILKSLKDIVRLSGLDPAKLADDREVLQRGMQTWMHSGDLQRVVLEIFHPQTDVLLCRWDVEVAYGWDGGDGAFWVDTDAVQFAIKKAGVMPSAARYRVVVTTKPGRPDVAGWSSVTLRSTAGLIEQRVGTTVESSGLSGELSYYRKS